MSEAELDDIRDFGGFRPGPNSFEGKLFATSAEDAAAFGRINDTLTGSEPFFIVTSQIPEGVDAFEFIADSMQAIHVDFENLGELASPGVLDAIPFVRAPR